MSTEKAHESNHPVVTKGSSADRGRGEEQDRACLRPAASALPLPLPGHSRQDPKPCLEAWWKSKCWRASMLDSLPVTAAHTALEDHSYHQGGLQPWGCGMERLSAWQQKKALLMGQVSSRCTCARKIRAEAASYGERALTTISAASPMHKTPNGVNTYILINLPWQLCTGRLPSPPVSSRLTESRGELLLQFFFMIKRKSSFRSMSEKKTTLLYNTYTNQQAICIWP